jgi:hypothetical protein
MAQHTIEATTQQGVRDLTNMKGSRIICHWTQQLLYKPLNAVCYTDTMLAVMPSLFNKYTCAQIYVSDFVLTMVYS